MVFYGLLHFPDTTLKIHCYLSFVVAVITACRRVTVIVARTAYEQKLGLTRRSLDWLFGKDLHGMHMLLYLQVFESDSLYSLYDFVMSPSKMLGRWRGL